MRLSFRCGNRLVELREVADDAHAAAAAACGRLDDQRRHVRLGNDRHAGFVSDALRRDLVAAGAERIGRRADPAQPCRVDRRGEVGVLGKEPVAGVHRVGARLYGRAQMLGAVEVRGDLDDTVGRACVERRAVVRCDDRHRREPTRLRGAKDTQGDLAAVGHEDGLHARDGIDRRRPNSVARQSATSST